MRTLILAIVLTLGCGGKDKAKEKEAGKAALVTPKVDVASVLLKESAKLPYLLVVDDAGVRVGAPASWADLDAGELKLTKKAGPLREIHMRLREDFALDRERSETVAAIDEYADSDVPHVDLTSLEDTTARNANLSQDDPPPPEEEDKPEDGDDPSGGTGTAMALEEGKMGKKDSDRAEGQYKMQKNLEDPELVRMQAIERARTARLDRIHSTNAKAGAPAGALPYGMPSRVSEVQGLVIEEGTVLVPLRAMILIAPTAKATKLIEVLVETDGVIAVSHAGKIRPLRLQFVTGRGMGDAPKNWLEVRVSAKGFVVEAVPDKPIEITKLEELKAALDKARTTRGVDADAVVDVLVDAGIDTQRMVDVIVALDVAGVRTIGLGSMPVADQLARRGKRIPSVAVGQLNAQGDLDKAIIRGYVKRAVPKIRECYDKALVRNSKLEGTVMTQFFISPNGSVASATGSGVDPEMANCVAAVIKAIEFPKPKGGGGVQVNYPFIMRP